MNYKLQTTNKHWSLVIALGLIILSQLIGACQRQGQPSGGSVVGNGFIRHYDESYDYFFDYAPELNFENISESSIQLDNESYASRLGLRTSVMTLHVVDLQAEGLSSISELKDKIIPSSNWQTIDNSQKNGFYHEQLILGTYNADHLFKIGKTHVLQVTVSAYPEAKGIKLLTDVIKSIGFDTKSPIIHEVLYEPAVINAGEKAKIKIRATDNMNQINGASPTHSVAIYTQQKCRQLMNKDWNLIEACGEFKRLGNNWYEIEIPTNPRMHPGEYVLAPLTLWDKAGNSVELIPNFTSRHYRANSRDEHATLPLVTLQIRNDHPDNFAPRFSNAHFDPSTIAAGETTKLLFEAVDNDPNFYPHEFCEKAMHKRWFKYVRSDVPKDAELEPTIYAIEVCSKPRKRPDGLWEVAIKTEQGLPPGAYEMNLSVSDSVGNRSHQESLTLTVTNAGLIDLEGPKIIDLKTDKASYRQGDVGMLTIHATDDISGVSEEATYLRLDLCRKGFVPKNLSEDDKNANNRMLICDGTLKKLGDGIYGMEFKIPSAVPIGVYTLPDISLADKVGNRTYLTTKSIELNTETYLDKYSNIDTKISTLTIHITE